MLRQAARRHCVGCYKILSSNYHHVTKGRSVLHVLRPSVTTQQIWRHPECMKATRLLPGLCSKSFSSTDVENTVDIPEVLDKTKGLGRLKNVFKMSAIECYEEADNKKLYVKIKDAQLSALDIRNMSDDIIDVFIKTNQFAFLKFQSEEDTDKNLKILSERDEFAAVNYVGQKLSLQKAEQEAKRLRLYLADSAMTKADVKSMAEGMIRNVNLTKGGDKWIAYLDFDSEDDAIRAFKQIKQDSRVSQISFLGDKMIQAMDGKMNLYLPVDGGVTKEDLLKLSDDILEVRFAPKNIGGAFLDFGSEEITEKNYRHIVSTLGKDARFAKEKGYKEARSLWMHVESTMTKKDILALSEDIFNVEFGKTSDNKRHAFLEFLSKEKMLKNMLILREKFGQSDVQRRTIVQREVDLCTLMLNNIEPSVTKEKVLNLSHHIIDARILDSSKEREGKRVFIEFVSENEAVQAYKRWKRNNLDVSFWGLKNRDEDSRKLYLRALNSDVTKEDILQLSDDLLDVDIFDGETDRNAFLEFESEEVAEKTYANLKETLGSAISFRSSELHKRDVKLLDLKDDETESSLMSLSSNIVWAHIMNTGDGKRIGFLDCGTKVAAVKTYLELADSRKVGFGVSNHWQNKILAEINDPRFILQRFRRSAKGVKSVDFLSAAGNRNARSALIEFDYMDNLERFMDSPLAEKMSARRLVNVKARPKFELYVADFQTKEELEQDLGIDSAIVRVRKDVMGRSYAFVGFDSKEAAEEGMEHLKHLGHRVEWADGPVKYEPNKSLVLLFNGLEVTADDVLELSKDIKKIVRLKQRQATNKVEALVEFESESVAEENFKALNSKEEETGLLVFFAGEKGRQWFQEQDERTVTIWFPNVNVTREDIQELSPDIIHIKLTRRSNTSYAKCEFASGDLAEQHYKEFEALGLNIITDDEKPKQAKKTKKNLIVDAKSKGNTAVDAESKGNTAVDAEVTGNTIVDAESTGNTAVDAESTQNTVVGTELTS